MWLRKKLLEISVSGSLFVDETEKIRSATIRDFGNQWHRHNRLDEDYWCDLSMLKDYFGPLLELDELEGCAIAEVGSGSGRIIRMLSLCHPRALHAIEPSEGVDILRRNTTDLLNVTIHNRRGDTFHVGDLDYIFSLGVIHHIKDPLATLKNIRKNLKPGGRFVVWVYGKENNGVYLAFYRSVQKITRRLNDRVLDAIAAALNVALVPYIYLCRHMRLPMRDYLVNVFAPCGMEKRRYIIFDQLNPTYAKYYTEQELMDVLQAAGFRDIVTYHRHGYSWTAICTN